MKSRLKKKVEKMERQKLHAMLDVVLNINGSEARRQEKTGMLPTAFFEFSGHVGIATVEIYPRGWPGDSNARTTIVYATSSGLKRAYGPFSAAIQQLKQVERQVFKQ